MSSAALILSICYLFLFVGSEFTELMRQYPRSPSSIECRNNANVSTLVDIQPRSQEIEIVDLLNGSVKINFERIPLDYVLLSFTTGSSNEYESTNHVNCWSTTEESTVISNLSDETHTFCFMNQMAHMVSPLDCLSFRSNIPVDDPIWLSEDDKPMAISLLVTGIILSLVVGFGIGVLIVRRQWNVEDHSNQSSGFTTPNWKNDNGIRDCNYPYSCDDAMSIASGKSYVTAVNPSRFDVIKMRIEKSENPYLFESENQYGLEDMPYAKAPTVPETFRDSGISTNGPIYAVSTKAIGQVESEQNGENYYLCVNDGVYNDTNSENKKDLSE